MLANGINGGGEFVGRYRHPSTYCDIAEIASDDADREAGTLTLGNLLLPEPLENVRVRPVSHLSPAVLHDYNRDVAVYLGKGGEGAVGRPARIFDGPPYDGRLGHQPWADVDEPNGEVRLGYGRVSAGSLAFHTSTDRRIG